MAKGTQRGVVKARAVKSMVHQQELCELAEITAIRLREALGPLPARDACVRAHRRAALPPQSVPCQRAL